MSPLIHATTKDTSDEFHAWADTAIHQVTTAMVLSSFLYVAGCSGIATTEADGAIAHHYFGYVKVINPASQDHSRQVLGSDVSTLGIRIGNGVGFGYMRDQYLSIPLDCRFVIFVKDKQQFDYVAAQVFDKFEEGPCVGILRERDF